MTLKTHHMDRLQKNPVTDSCIGCLCHGCDPSHEQSSNEHDSHDSAAQDIVAFLEMHFAFGNLHDPVERKTVDRTTRDWECGNRVGCDTIDALYDLRSQEISRKRSQERLHSYASVVSNLPSFLQQPAEKIVLLYNSIRRRI